MELSRVVKKKKIIELSRLVSRVVQLMIISLGKDVIIIENRFSKTCTCCIANKVLVLILILLKKLKLLFISPDKFFKLIYIID